MSRDYKAKSPPQPAKRGSPSFFAGVLTGLFIGLGTASLVAWYINKSPSPFVAREQPAEKPAMPEAKAQPASNPAAQKPRFDFYKILQGASEPAAQVPPSSAPPAEKDVSYYLQAGSFQKKEEADNMKAKLAMLGLEASIQPGTSADKGEVFRVRSGPFAQMEDLKKVADMLQQNGIASTVVKIHESAQQ